MENDLEKVLRLMLVHQEQFHPAQALVPSVSPTKGPDIDEDPTRCLTVLRKARKMLPKVMKEISSSVPNPKVLDTLCTLLSLFLSSDVCPFSPSVFSSNAGVILFYMVRFLATPEYASLHQKVFDVCTTLALLLLESDFNGYVHIYCDLVDLLEDLQVLERHTSWRPSEAITVHCFLVSGAHLGRDTAHMQSGLRLCCQREELDPHHAQLVFDMGKKTVPPLTFTSSATVRLFSVWMWRFLNKVVGYAATFLSHHPTMAQLCVLVGSLLDAATKPGTDVDGAVLELLKLLFTQVALTDFSLIHLSTSFFAYATLPHHSTESNLVESIAATAVSRSRALSTALWPSFQTFATSKRTDVSLCRVICNTLRTFLKHHEDNLHRYVTLLVDLVLHCDLHHVHVQRAVGTAIQSALDAHINNMWRHARAAIGQFHPEYVAVPPTHKRQKVVAKYASSISTISFEEIAKVMLATPPVDSFQSLVLLVLAMAYDNTLAAMGLGILLPLRRTTPSHPRTQDEGDVSRMLLDRLRTLLQQTPSSSSSTNPSASLRLIGLALRYATDDELTELPVMSTLLHVQKYADVANVPSRGWSWPDTTDHHAVELWMATAPPLDQFLMVLCWVYTRHDPLALVRDSPWRTSLSGRVFVDLVAKQQPTAVRFAPIWMSSVVRAGAATALDMWNTLADLLLPMATSARPAIACAVVATLGHLCCTLSQLSDEEPIQSSSSSVALGVGGGDRYECLCRKPNRPTPPLPRTHDVAAVLESLVGSSSTDATVVHQTLLTMAAWIKHSTDLPPSVVWRFAEAVGHPDPICQRAVETHIGVIAPLVPSSSQLLSLFDVKLGSTPRLAAAAVRAMATLGGHCDLQSKGELDLFFALVFRLVGVWKDSKTTTSAGLHQIMTHLTWKQLCVQYPDRVHVPLVESLVVPGANSHLLLQAFLAAFIGPDVTVALYLKENAAHILPHLIVTKNSALLQTMAAACGATVASLVGEHILAIVKEMLLQKVTSFNNVAEWEFFFAFIPHDVGIRDVIQHKPLTIIYALAWELAGDRPKVAKKSFIEVCKQFLDDEDHHMDTFHISQQFFLAVMTFLGQKLLSKNVRISIQAIQCTEVLLSLFDTVGALDNFVPKIMATLKLASVEAHADKILAACRAWRTFVRLLSPDAIKANVLSIVVSLLPCVGPLTELFQLHVVEGPETTIHPNKMTQTPPLSEAQQVALDVLRSIFTSEMIDDDPSVTFVLALTPMANDFPVQTIKHLPIHEVLALVLPLLQHWDGAVREVGLLHLIHILNSRSREVLDLVLSLEEGVVHTCIMGILKQLLRLSRLETQENMQLLVAQALGALGAIDMARITPQALRPITTNELSTKNLACHLVQTLLVNELRAAPQNTDVIALSIQQLLQFLAQLNAPDSSSSSTAASSSGVLFVPSSSSSMPEWMQRQFHSKGVDKIIAPYWSTKYQAPNFKPTTMPPSSTFYEALGSVAFDQWLVSWCKFLIDHSTFPERHIFLACRRALTISLEIARFLLPYLVQNVLKQSASYHLVKQEILSVLQEDSSVDSEASTVSSHHHQCAQTVFSMLDELNDWVWASQRKKIALSQQPHMAKHMDELFDQEKEVVEEFLKDIPLSLLSSAAFKIKAYARAIQYFESHLRQQGNNVQMTSTDMTKMQKMYGSLDEPDALLGLATQRRWLHPHPTGSFQELQHLIAEHKHLARWEDALACYEQAIHHMHGSDVEVEIRSELYAGVIQCMIQLGRLEGALQHVRGIVNQYPEVIPAVYPCALECAWRLSRWDLLTELTTDAMKVKLDKSEDMMGIKFAKTILCFHQNQLNMHVHLREARASIMGPLAAASQESYQRVYPLLHQLHFLHELEQGYLVSKASANKTAIWNAQCPWNRRDAMMAPALKFQEPILALRRVMMEDLQLDRSIVSANWLQYGKMARKEGLLRTAESAVMHAQALGNRHAIIEQAKLLVERGNMYEALHVLEPIPIDVSTIMDPRSSDNHFDAKMLLLATNYMQQSSQKQGQHVIDRYKAVIAFDKDYAKGYFCLAKYFEVLLANDRREGDDASGEPYAYLPHVLHNYVLSLKGTDKYLFQSLPRLLTLWYEFGEILQASQSTKRSYRLDIPSSSEHHYGLMQDISKIILDALHSLPESMWLVCFPQVTSRICHPNVAVVDGVKAIMVRVLMAFPQRAMWYVLGLAQSLNMQRKTRAIEILKVAQKQLTNSNQVDMANALSEGMRLVEELIKLAEVDPGNQKKMPIRLSRVRAKVLLPIQSSINRRDLPESDVYIKSFGDKADVMLTKEKPKRIQVQGTDGKTYSFLCKREKHGDLRKDARMMEFNALMNKLLQRETDGRKRKLRLRTYAVICLNEESGLMEWVPNTRAMRHLISQIYKTEQGFLQPVRLTTDIKDTFLNMQKQYAHDIPHMTLVYRTKILTHLAFTPRFHQWFLNNFSDPTA
ncbi:hypothetical protein DYB26_006270, partial [Aphanomyces astaci]